MLDMFFTEWTNYWAINKLAFDDLANVPCLTPLVDHRKLTLVISYKKSLVGVFSDCALNLCPKSFLATKMALQLHKKVGRMKNFSYHISSSCRLAI